MSEQINNTPAATPPGAAASEIAKLNAPDSDLWSNDAAKQKVAAARLSELLAADLTPYAAGTSASIPEQRRMAEARAAKEAEAAKLAARTPVQVEIAKLNAPDSDLWNFKDEAKQKTAAARLRELLAQDRTPEEVEADEQAPIGKLRERFGVEIDWPSKTHEANFDTNHEANFYNFAINRGWTGDLVRDLVDDYLRAVDGLGTPITDDALDRLGKKYTGRISDADRALLRRWVREEIEGG